MSPDVYDSVTADRIRPRDTVFPLAQGDGWVVVAKPPRVLVHRNWAFPGEVAMLQRVRDWARTRVYPIHRIDRNTSGCLLFATKRKMAGPLSACLRSEDTQKTYVCLVRGTFPHEGTVRVDTPVKIDKSHYKDALSFVDKLGHHADPRCALLRVRPRTGRTHQVRRHVRDLHHPIIHDGDHGDSRVNRWWRENRGVSRLQLHNLRLDMPHPDGGRIQAVCPLFGDLHAAWSVLDFWSDAVAAEPGLALPPLPLPPMLSRRPPATAPAGAAAAEE